MPTAANVNQVPQQSAFKISAIKYTKIALKLLGVALLVFICYAIWRLSPSKLERLESEFGALAYTELLALSKQVSQNSQPNPDPYAASQITPDNPLFNGVLAYQRGQYSAAAQAIKPLADAGDAAAMFWYGEVTTGKSIYYSAQAGEWFNKAASKGSPYAARKLDPDTSNCEMVDIRVNICNPEWYDKAPELFAKKADTGDVMASFYANQRSIRFGNEADYHTNITLITEAAKAGYYSPLYAAILRFEQDKDLTPEKKQAIVDLLTLAANHNFVPAMEKLTSYFDLISDKSAVNWQRQLTVLGHKGGLTGLSISLLYKKDSIEKSVLKEAYKLSLVENTLFSNSRVGRNLIALSIKNGSATELTDAEKQQAQVAADKFISQMTPVIYIDEMHPRNIY
ncbi:hypothetical protein HQQ94_02915 [Shewanella sp. VB17]|uniref:hypothetical protein n=1 Tax=Shewanella sp. VB17 TaxID=2739432 RepID=UPI001565085E|nr:hypothetical protein [Shewanella sp. VB17]NRD72204.1 hypothetical protein [Shewanella sp. VB17]